MEELTNKDIDVVLSALNLLLKSEQNALVAAQTIVPIAVKVERLRPQSVETKAE
jgi:hypothetical protein